MFRAFLPSALALVCATGPTLAAPIITVTPSVAPNAFGSPNWSGYVANATTALRNNQSSAGSPASPSYYQALGTGGTVSLPFSSIVVTSFPSWLGQTNPGSAFGPAYADELGNRLHFGLQIDGNGSTFSLSQLSFDLTSTDPDNALSFSIPNYEYNGDFLGINSNGDVITSGSADQPLVALFYRGSGNAFEILDPAALAPFINSFTDPFTLTGTYTLTGDFGQSAGSSTVQVTPVPEPSTVVTLLAGLAGLAVYRRRRLRRELTTDAD